MITIPTGSKVEMFPGGRRILYPQTGERLIVQVHQYAPPDPRDAEIERLQAQVAELLREVETLKGVQSA